MLTKYELYWSYFEKKFYFSYESCVRYFIIKVFTVEVKST